MSKFTMALLLAFLLTLATAATDGWLTVTDPPTNYSALKTQMGTRSPPQNYFEVTTSQMCKSCIDYVDTVHSSLKEGMDYYSDYEYTKGQCCLYNCVSEGAGTSPPSYASDGVASHSLDSLKELKYYMCPTGEADYRYCGAIDGQALSSKTVAAKSDGSKSKWIIGAAQQLYSGTPALCVLGVR